MTEPFPSTYYASRYRVWKLALAEEARDRKLTGARRASEVFPGCAQCGEPDPSPMLTEEVWKVTLGLPSRGCILCFLCTETRLGRRLTAKDLADVPGNRVWRALIARSPAFEDLVEPPTDAKLEDTFAGHIELTASERGFLRRVISDNYMSGGWTPPGANRRTITRGVLSKIMSLRFERMVTPDGSRLVSVEDHEAIVRTMRITDRAMLPEHVERQPREPHTEEDQAFIAGQVAKLSEPLRTYLRPGLPRLDIPRCRERGECADTKGSGSCFGCGRFLGSELTPREKLTAAAESYFAWRTDKIVDGPEGYEEIARGICELLRTKHGVECPEETVRVDVPTAEHKVMRRVRVRGLGVEIG